MSEVPTYAALGMRLRYARQQKQQSLAEVSGAVEIDETVLDRIETGVERPSEDILMLLINYFDIQDSEAVRLWEMGNYSTDLPDELKMDIDSATQKVIMLIAQEVRTLYSDNVSIEANPSGVTIEFAQSAAGGQRNTVARIGMSTEQARTVVNALQTALLYSQYDTNAKQLPPTTL